jgi:hypothetical protein
MERKMTQIKIKEILDMLNTLNEYFLSLPDDMLLGIDPRDNESLERGFQFIRQFNDSLSDFTSSSAKIEAQIKKYFSINPEEDDVEKESSKENINKRIVKELDKTESHSLDENFTYKRPYGFVLADAAYKGIKTWKSLYMQALKELNAQNSELFLKLPEEERFISKRGNSLFSKDGSELRIPEELFSGFFVEINLSANHIRNNIKELLEHFEIKYKEFKIYLREDRDA